MASDLEKIQKELKWIQIREERDLTFFEKLKKKGVFGLLVPAGCLFTAGVLAKGLVFMSKRNSKGQQQMMRYRVGAQGVTIALAVFSILIIPLTKPK